MNREEELLGKLHAGTLNDVEITEILDRGSPRLKNEFRKVVDKKFEEKRHYARVTGISEKNFDGLDKDGNPFKDYKLVDMATEDYYEGEN